MVYIIHVCMCEITNLTYIHVGSLVLCVCGRGGGSGGMGKGELKLLMK